jgi:PAS domain S-box-containing protein
MAGTTLQHLGFTLERVRLLRCAAIALLVALCTLTYILSFALDIDILTTPLFFIPIIYAVYVFPRRGIIVSAICACVYEFTGYVFRYPDPVGLAAITLQAILFVGIASIVAFLIGRTREEEAHYRTVFEYSQMGIVSFDRQNEIILRCNRKFADMLGFTCQELQVMKFPDILFSPAEVERFRVRMNLNTEIEDFETRFKTKDGAVCWVNLSWSRLNPDTISCTVVNINARKLAEKTGNNYMTKYRQLTENSPVGILIVQDGIIRYANPAFSRFLGIPTTAVLGKNICTFAEERDRASCYDREKAWEEHPADLTASGFRFQPASGELRTAELIPMPSMYSGKPAVLIYVIDTTEKQLLKDKIECDSERRRGILMTIAHELRTPLQPILGYLNLLIDDPKEAGLTGETQKILERCLESADRERQIINRMLDLSVLDSGNVQLTTSDFSLTDLVQNAIDTNGYATQADITKNIPKKISVVADKPRIFVVLDSILSNAVQYSSPPRTISIDYHSDDTDLFHHLSITDNGIGIPAPAQSSVFEPFQLADGTNLSRKFDRIGLSLAIAKKIMETHGGDITFRSTPGGGSTFTLHLPKTPLE